ncbi:hypothetical protein [Mucilaginibacter psychrotolerans]|uniref:Uncharacterized protein n=1 Tax=Mucilaginibacter psychrotolerans TaxID=1524096 RepID=A0A4Y8S962_9SPHI|nr:hypothetical protein [Mucilaginibacter psychrotolerans]TFF35623.1 hypothetical protein E2R66_18110 [Mucilaginibacter psychrotolerans]
MKNNRPLIRRTFLQERFDILIKKQRNGTANFNDLTELDEIVNRDPAIRESILEEMHEMEHPSEGPKQEEEIIAITPIQQPSFLAQLKNFFHRLFTAAAPNTKAILVH